MSDLQGKKRAKVMAARAPKEYATIKAEAEARVVRWLWASFDVHSYEPAYFEINKFPRGKLLPGEPDPPTHAIGYGYDAQGRVVVERRQTEFPGHVGETFYLHEPHGIMQFLYDSYTPEKRWIAVTWFAMRDGRVVAKHSVYNGGARTTTYQYNDRGQMVRRECRGIDALGEKIDDWRELEYDEKGKIVRIYWCYPDGRRILHFERATRKTSLKARKRELLEGLTAAIIEAIRQTAVTDEVYVLALRYFDAHDEHIPPLISLNTVPERERLMREHGDYGLEAIWNPCEWQPQWQELDVKLSPELEAMCKSANEDIWQNEQEQRALMFLVQLARTLNKVELPIRRADGFVCVVLAPEVGNMAAQVSEQITAKTRKKLRQGGWLAG